MRTLLLLLLGCSALGSHGQAPDEQRYWLRFVVVENDTALTPLRGPCSITLLQRGQWWSYMDFSIPGGFAETRLTPRPLFSGKWADLRTTPSRGTELPDERLRIVRGADTLLLDLSTERSRMMTEVDERCARMGSDLRPPVVIPFAVRQHARPATIDSLARRLTVRFDRLWQQALKEGTVLRETLTDTCRSEVQVPATFEAPLIAGEPIGRRDHWLLRSPYCGHHLVRFPPLDGYARYIIHNDTLSGADPLTLRTEIRSSANDEAGSWIRVDDWPVGDYSVTVETDQRKGLFFLKVR